MNKCDNLKDKLLIAAFKAVFRNIGLTARGEEETGERGKRMTRYKQQVAKRKEIQWEGNQKARYVQQMKFLTALANTSNDAAKRVLADVPFHVVLAKWQKAKEEGRKWRKRRRVEHREKKVHECVCLNPNVCRAKYVSGGGSQGNDFYGG